MCALFEIWWIFRLVEMPCVRTLCPTPALALIRQIHHDSGMVALGLTLLFANVFRPGLSAARSTSSIKPNS